MGESSGSSLITLYTHNRSVSCLNYPLKSKWYKVIHLKILFRSSITPHKLKKVNWNVSALCRHCCWDDGYPNSSGSQRSVPFASLTFKIRDTAQPDWSAGWLRKQWLLWDKGIAMPAVVRGVFALSYHSHYCMWIRRWDGVDSNGKFWANWGTQSSRSSVFMSQAVNDIVQLCPIAGLLGNSVDGLASKELKRVGIAFLCLHIQSLFIWKWQS